MIFKHPTTEIELEGTYIIKSTVTGKYVYLSDVKQCSSTVILREHEAIVEHLNSYYGIDGEIDDDFTPLNLRFSFTFMDA